MKYSRLETPEIIRLVERSDLPVRRTLEQLQVGRASFYHLYRAYADAMRAGLTGHRQRGPVHQREQPVPHPEEVRPGHEPKPHRDVGPGPVRPSATAGA